MQNDQEKVSEDKQRVSQGGQRILQIFIAAFTLIPLFVYESSVMSRNDGKKVKLIPTVERITMSSIPLEK